MLAIIGLFVGALLGVWLDDDVGATLGAIAGFFAGFWISKERRKKRAAAAATQHTAPIARGPILASESTNARIEALERRVATLERHAADRQREQAPWPGEATQTAPPNVVADSITTPKHAPGAASADEERTPVISHLIPRTARSDIQIAFPDSPGVRLIATSGAAAPSTATEPIDASAPEARPADAHSERTTGPTASSSAPPVNPPSPLAGNPLWIWFTSGNALTRVGVVILLIGVGFLLKYFAEHFTMPIELRLAGVAAGGFAIMALGLRLAGSRPGYGLSLQGAGAGVLYLTTFAAFEFYGVLAAAPAITLLIAVTALTVFLAVRNDSQALAALAIAGGFLAPVLVGGSGGPVLLFGYFALLNAAIFVLAWTKAWRALNAVGFVFTFVLGMLWGEEFYRLELFSTVEPFLLLFFVFYVAIAILYARRGPLVPTQPVDALLVFGVPLVGFALQAALVRDMRYGAAWSALVLGVVYAFLFLAMRKRGEPGFALLSRAFLALAVIFITIAIPLAFDNRATAALWAVEAAGVYWIGIRQNTRLTRAFALVIELGAGIAFASSGLGVRETALFANAFFAGAMLIALSGLATARIAEGASTASTALSMGERSLIPLVFAWGVLWWLLAGSLELGRKLPRDQDAHAILGWTTASVALALAFIGPLKWPRLAAVGAVLLPVMVAVALDDFRLNRTTLTVFGWWIWPCAWFVHWCVLYAADRFRDGMTNNGKASVDVDRLLPRAHIVSGLAFTAQLSWEASEWAGRWTSPHTVWTPCAAAIPAIVYLWLAVRLHSSERWPANRYRAAYTIGAGTPIALLLALWFFAVNILSPGDASPLRYLPILNPLDITLALALIALTLWGQRFSTLPERARYRWLGVGLFVALNGVVLRTAHQWGNIRWQLSALLASKPLQAALTLTWTITASALMQIATRRAIRPLWMLGAGLLVAVIAKLVLVDLSFLSGLPRVIAFLGAGALLLVISYLSPLPPSSSSEEGERDKASAA